MKNSVRFLSVLLAFGVWVSFTPADAVTIQKAPGVAVLEQQKGIGGLMAGNSLIPTALGLVGNVMALSQQQAALSAECEPTDAEITFVKNLMQEWARAGGAAPNLSPRPECSKNQSYASSIRNLAEGMYPCWNSFNGTQDSFQIYYRYPFPGKGYKLKDPSAPDNDKNRMAMSDMYEIFAKIGFEEADYMPNEVSQAARIKEKSLNCAPAILSAKQKELWGNMLMTTVGGLGQKQNAGATMGQVAGIMSQPGGGSPLGALMGVAPVLTGSLFGGQ
ncbi:MAG: hypothetical protein FWE50_02810 [Alphaproteobacteria bacterium]|nr:hypothetical protein [Alphaproteobacteria bacterium]